MKNCTCTLQKHKKWHRYAIANLKLECYHNEFDGFLCHVVVLDKTWPWAYEPELKWQLSEWYHPSAPHLKKLPGTQQCQSDADYFNDVILHHNIVED